MLGQYWAGVLHPMIHVGYGLEFGILGLIAEGLAMGATSDLINSDILGKSFFKSIPAPDNVVLAASVLSSLSLRNDPPSAHATHGSTDTTVFDMLASILADERLATHKSKDLFTELEFTMNERGSLVFEHADRWTIDVSKPGEIKRKIEELFWLNTLIYAVAGWSEDKEFRGDFFYMHLVTSALFLPSHITYLSPRSQILLLRSYLTMSLLTYIFRGRPPVDSPAITAFWNGTTTAHNLVTPTGPLSVPHTPVKAVPADAAQNLNPWLPLVQSAILNKNDHHAKIVRTLLHCAQVYGSHPKGHWAGKGGSDAIRGLEVLDGTLFLRAAELMTWFERDENQEWGPGHQRWAFEGFYE
ncbi:hypothetical protein CONPUDRAFT_151496 [Coniophora puteana RWD-64-598 SS2]|uniref:Uncharacterized protein n=1 Tax=Coniophora puteana (strain RWD-64-598) TaxID=741705 RepID=A0A5M3MZA9_CONPW|nr:uncharacterized protein CONPUDRAFT_151496 [Coniophora puteana RWD-64-598 SS2]EIW84478.1 hypothetical protein CONPUDRAFT_151496 [Coniophora puteana RWD-64-598 SS2]